MCAAWVAGEIDEARTSGTDVRNALRVALDVGHRLPLPGHGATSTRWQVLADLARANVTVGRVVEAHTDALAIRAEAGIAEIDDRTWGVFAAESRTADLACEQTGYSVTLSGHKPWCSLAGYLDAALVTARAGDQRQLFEVDLHHPGVSVNPANGWVARGLPTVVSTGVDFDTVPARPVGAPGWYLDRPGFSWGGIGVAACWLGAARGVADALSGARASDITDLHAGRADLAVHAAQCVLEAAARQVDSGCATGEGGAVLALRVRSIVADSCETVLREVAHATGPAPLAFDDAHAARVADLEIYLRQHHGERDVAALGARVRL